MAASVYKICKCRDQVKCRHPWWFSFKQRDKKQLRWSLDVVFERHIDSKTVAEQEASRLRLGIRDDTLSAEMRKRLRGLPVSLKPVLEVLTLGQLLDRYKERHLAQTATTERQTYQIGAIVRTAIIKPDGTSAPLGSWLVSDVTADALERLREARVKPDIHKRTTTKGSNRVGGHVAANRDLRLLRAAFNWAIRVGYVERTPFKRGTISAVTLTRESARSRRLQTGEEEQLLHSCRSPRLHAIIVAALEAGCRKGELLHLTWSQVNLTGRPELWLPADKTKTGRARRVPISTRLKPVLEMRLEALRATLDLEDGVAVPGGLYVFGNEIGQRVDAIKTSWLNTCRRAKIVGLHFHDLRREAGSRWMEAGVPLATIQKWLGHTNIAQTSTYLATTTAGEHEAMRRFEERIGRLIPIDTEGATPPLHPTQSAPTDDDKPQQTSTKH